LAYIRVIGPSEADGFLKRQYDDAIKWAGGVANIFSVQGHNPKVLESSIEFHRDVMYGESPLSRARREMLAVIVSDINECYY
jgi:alkylhydroperoxidase family enzyme